MQTLVADTEKYLLVEIDSIFCKVHQHAAGARKKYGKQAIGVSRGGKNTKIHALVTEYFQLIGLLLTGGQVVINGNGHKFEGFIVASEFRYAAQSGTKTAKYTQNERAMYYYIDSSNNIYTTSATGTDALDTYHTCATKSTYSGFNLSSESHFRNFTAESDVNFMYVYYDYDCVMDSSPFYLNTGDLIPLYKLVNGKQVRVTNWDDVNLYDSNDMNKRNLIPKVVTDTSRKGTVRLTNGSPSPLYDEAGNPVYFCDDYVNLTGTYTVFTLDRVADGSRDPKEFLLTKTDELNTPNTDDWK